MRARRLLSTGLVAGAALFALDCASSASRPRPSAGAAVEPTLWQVLRPDGSAAYHLLGSVHVGRGAPPRFPVAIEKAFARAEELVLEFDPTSPVSERESARLMQRYGMIPPPESLRDRVSSPGLVALDAYLQKRGEPLAPYLQFEPWWLVEYLGDEAKRRRGLDPAFGVDRHFALLAAERGLPVVELESAERQLRILAELPAAIHEQRLLEALAHPGGLGERAEALLRAWENGDQRELERNVFGPLESAPELRVFYERVIFQRNERMAGRLDVLSRDGKLRFAVIGAGHLIGARGIPALLHARGFRIMRRQP